MRKNEKFNISKHYPHLSSILIILCLASYGLCQDTGSVEWPVTRAEKSDYQETSLYADVIQFLETLQLKGAPISVEYIGESPEGRRLPLVIASRPMVAGPADARRSGRPIVYLQANIHAGEVEGKEATLMLLRDLAREPVGKGMLDEIVLLTTPIYNIDGNEKISENNRRGQNGPVMAGERRNGQNLDLNRDGIKAESNEMQAVLKHVYTLWEPDAIIDLHTTNGSRHGYQLTYAPALYPNLDKDVAEFNRDKLLPTVRKRLQAEHDIQVFDYGNTSRGRRGQEQPQQQIWRTFECDPRYVSNYAGARNRIGVLSETVTYVPFDNRVRVAYHFTRMVLDEIRINKEEVVRLMRQADARVIDWGRQPERAPELGVAFTMDNRGVEDMLLEKPGTYDRSVIGPPKELETVKVEVWDRFKVTKTSKFPAAYMIPAEMTAVVELLGKHGVVVEKLLGDWSGDTEAFMIEAVGGGGGRRTFSGGGQSVTGQFAKNPNAQMEAGSYMVRTAQPLGILAFTLLEPENPDSVAAGGFVNDYLKVNEKFPILKCFEQVKVPTERVR